MLRDPICAVTVSVGYSDFLSETAKWNRHHFDRWVVVTCPSDDATREVCRKFDLRCVTSLDHARDSGFSKGRMVERGLQHLPHDTFVLHLDADIVLPTSFRHDLEKAHLSPTSIYGADRLMVKSWEDWQKFQATGWLFSTSRGYGPHTLSFPQGYSLGSRWIGKDGYVPIGFFQLWHRLDGQEEWKGIRNKSYPSGHGLACREDVQMGMLFDRRDRELLPELVVVHLESEACPTGTNWKGRKTKRFGPASGKPDECSPS